MSIDSTVLTALKTVLANTWADELPPNPTWPAIVFDVETVPENTWVAGGGYNQHVVSVTVFAKTRTQLRTLHLQATAALQALPNHLETGESGNADYEEDPSVYAHFSNHTIRLLKSES